MCWQTVFNNTLVPLFQSQLELVRRPSGIIIISRVQFLQSLKILPSHIPACDFQAHLTILAISPRYQNKYSAINQRVCQHSFEQPRSSDRHDIVIIFPSHCHPVRPQLTGTWSRCQLTAQWSSLKSRVHSFTDMASNTIISLFTWLTNAEVLKQDESFNSQTKYSGSTTTST